MERMDMINQLNNSKEILNITQKLPQELRKQWRKLTLKTTNNNIPVTFLNLVEFIKEKSKLLNQPLFRNN